MNTKNSSWCLRTATMGTEKTGVLADGCCHTASGKQGCGKASREAGSAVLVPPGVRGSLLRPCRRHLGNPGSDPGTEVPGYSRAAPPGLPSGVFVPGSLRTAKYGDGRQGARATGRKRAANPPVGTACRRLPPLEAGCFEGIFLCPCGRVFPHGAPWGRGRKKPFHCTAWYSLGTAWNGLDRVFWGLYMFSVCLRTATMRTATIRAVGNWSRCAKPRSLRTATMRGTRASWPEKGSQAYGYIRLHTATYGCIRLFHVFFFWSISTSFLSMLPGPSDGSGPAAQNQELRGTRPRSGAVCWGPLSRRISPNLGVSRGVSPFSETFFAHPHHKHHGGACARPLYGRTWTHTDGRGESDGSVGSDLDGLRTVIMPIAFFETAGRMEGLNGCL
ncbi:MAG: hypothetical protein JWR26_59 [Pedosphaera sp.]|nr:hypothetical protein [Pedosphaera sp.]